MTLKYGYPLLAIFLTACGSDSENQIIEKPIRPVRSITIEQQQQGSIRTFSGTAQSGEESKLSFRVSGTVNKIHVDIGQQLKKGQIIAELDPAQYQIQAEKSKATLAQSKANQRNAESNFERAKNLYETNSTSRNELDSARANAESTRAQTNAYRLALELSLLNVNYTKLKATTDCNVATKETEINEFVTSGQTVVKVICGKAIEVQLAVPESSIALIKDNMAASVNFSALPNQSFEARVSEVGIASNGSPTYPVTVILTHQPEELRSGLAAEVSFNFKQKEQRFIVPSASVSEDTQGRYVFTLQPAENIGNAIVKRQSVAIGELTPSGLEITEGLKINDRVITAGVNVVRDGLVVKAD
jgi:multidrug efflux system membrane fusion protein